MAAASTRAVKTKRLYRSMATIGLGQMCFPTTLLHAYLNSSYWNTPYEERSCDEHLGFVFVTLFLFVGLAIVWGIGMWQWLSCLDDISPLIRSNSVIGGFVAPNIALIYLLLNVSSPSLQTYATYTLWPVYVGLVIGAVAVPFFEVCMKVSCLIWLIQIPC